MLRRRGSFGLNSSRNLSKAKTLTQSDRRYYIMTPEEINKFSMAIEEMVYMKDIPYIDAICMFAEQNNIEMETAGKLVSGVLKAKIQLEAEDLNFLKKSKTAKLPI